MESSRGAPWLSLHCRQALMGRDGVTKLSQLPQQGRRGLPVPPAAIPAEGGLGMMEKLRISGGFALGAVPAFPSASPGLAARYRGRADPLGQQV